MRRPECLLATYQQAAEESNTQGKPPLALWSNDLLQRIGASSLARN
jgi:hypothetical protein